MAIQSSALVGLASVAARRAAYLRIMRRRMHPGQGSSLELLLSRGSSLMPDLNSLLPGARYVVVGGTATSLYMAPRTTQDVDILVSASDAPSVEDMLRRAGAKLKGPLSINNPLEVDGDSWQLPDGTDLDVLRSAQPWVGEALAKPNHDPAGLPVISLPYLVLMKLASGRGVDMGDLSRMLGGADEKALAEIRRVVSRHLPDAVDDVESLAELGRWELQPAPPSQTRPQPSAAGAGEVTVHEHTRGGRPVREHTRRRPRH